MDTKKIGRQIQLIRKARGNTQAELAQMVDLTPKYLSNLECGDKMPKLDTFISIANALECDANSLLVDVLNVSTIMVSSSISEKLSALPVEEQRKILRLLEVMIDDAAK
jgi:transcriptional regulator with XRE-family HTH domain